MRHLAKRLNSWWLAYEYKHTTLAIIAIIAFVVLVDATLLATAVRALDGSGVIGAVLAGLFSVSFFTAAPALVVIIDLTHHLDPLLLAFLVALGSMLGDWLLLKFFEEKIFEELKPIARKLNLHNAKRWLSKPATKWILIVTGGLIISSPLPEEAGLALMGITHYNRFVILTICFVLNMIGALLLVGAVSILA